MVKNKKGWIRIVEAVVAILILVGIVLILLSKEDIQKDDMSNDIYKIESSILNKIRLDDSLREEILTSAGNYPNVETKINEDCFIELSSDEIYVKSAFIGASLNEYNPKQLKLFCWE